MFNDNLSENIVLCSKEKFEQNKTPFCKYIPIQESNNVLDLNNVLDVLGDQGITSILVEGGAKLIKSFIDSNLIDEIYLYTSNRKLDNATLVNPLEINEENWTITQTKEFDNDNLIIARKKELCFQEL